MITPMITPVPSPSKLPEFPKDLDPSTSLGQFVASTGPQLRIALSNGDGEVSASVCALSCVDENYCPRRILHDLENWGAGGGGEGEGGGGGGNADEAPAPPMHISNMLASQSMSDPSYAGLSFFMNHATESEEKIWDYFDSYLKSAMCQSMLPPILGFPGFRIKMDHWQKHAIRDREYRRLDKRQKTEHELTQAKMVEMLSAAGYYSTTKGFRSEYKVFKHNAAKGALKSYRFVSSVGWARPDVKLRCPDLLKEMLNKICDAQEDTVCSFIDNNTDFVFLSDVELQARLVDDRFFFPFENLQYNSEIVPKLWTILGTAATRMMDHESPHNGLSITVETKECISDLYTWIASSYASGNLQVQVPML